MLLAVPYLFSVLCVTGLIAIPFYYFNQYLIQKIKPRESGKKLLLYFITIVACAFIYISIGVFAIVYVAKIFM
jgi:hypothetical protein